MNTELILQIYNKYRVETLLLRKQKGSYIRCCDTYLRKITICKRDNLGITIQARCINCCSTLLDYNTTSLEDIIPYMENLYTIFNGKTINI